MRVSKTISLSKCRWKHFKSYHLSIFWNAQWDSGEHEITYTRRRLAQSERISKLHRMIAVALCSHVSACNLNKLAQIPLQLYWSPVIISCFGTELDSWGCCRYVTLWVGVIMGNELQALATGFFSFLFFFYRSGALSGRTPGTNIYKAHNVGWKFMS